MADNTVLNAGSGGNTQRTLEDASGVHWPVGSVAYATTVSSGANVLTIPTAAALADNTANPTTLLQGSCLMAFDGSTWDRAPGDATNGLTVNLGSNNDVTLATLPDTSAGDLAAINSAVSGTLTVDLGANNDVTIDNSSIVLTEDAVHNTGDAGVMSLAVRNDTLAALAGTDGDYAPLQVSAEGALYVEVSGNGALPDTAAGDLAAINSAVSGTLTVDLGANNDVTIDNSSIVLAEDAVHNTGDAGVMALAVRNDTLAALAGTDGDYAPLQVSAEGALFIEVSGNGTLPDTSGGDLSSIATDAGTLAAAVSGNEVNVDLASSSGVNGIDSPAKPVMVGGAENDGTVRRLLTDSDGHLQIDVATGAPNLISTNNSSTSALGISGVFEGTGDDVSQYTSVSVIVDSDQDSATDGLQLQFSTDDSNWDDSTNFTYSAANSGRTFTTPVVAQYFRVRYTNGGTGQGTFRLQTILHRRALSPEVERLVSDTDPQHDAIVTKSALIAQASGSGDFVPVQATAGGNLKVGIEDVSGGQATMANSLPVVIASDQSALDVSGATVTTTSAALYVDDADWTAASSTHALVGGVYQSTPGAITDGDTGPVRLNANGAMHVSIQEGGGTGGTSETDDGAFTAGSGSGTPIMGFATADTVDSGDVGVLGMDTSRNLKVSIEVDNAGIGGGTQYTEDDIAPANPVGNALLAERDNALGGLTPAEGDWTHLYTDANGALWTAVNNTVSIQEATALDVSAATVTVDLGANNDVQGAAAEGAAVSGNPFLIAGDDGTNVKHVAVAADGAVHIDDGGNTITVDGTVTANAGTGTFTIQEASALDVSAATVTVDLGANNDVQGNLAQDLQASSAGKPFLTAGRAASSEPSPVSTNGDIQFIQTDMVGKLITQPFAPTDQHWQNDGNKTDTTDIELAAAAGAGVRNYLTDIMIYNASATDAAVIIKDGSTEIARLPAPANGGCVHRFGVPLKTTANMALNAASSASVTTMYVSGTGYTGR